MHHRGFRYEIQIELEFHPIDLILLFYASKRHYDRRCQALIERDHEGMPGALRAAICYLEDTDGNWVRSDEPLDTEEKTLKFLSANTHLRVRNYYLTFRQIDTMAKTMEYYAVGAQMRKLIGELDIGVDLPESPPQAYIDHVNEGLIAALDAINARHQEISESVTA